MEATFRQTPEFRIAHDVSNYTYINYVLNLMHYPKFKAAIYCFKPQQAHEVAGKLRSLTGTTCLVRKFNTWSPNYTFEFPNGSRILVRVPSETVRGYRQHAIYVDDFVSDEMKELTRHYLIKYDARFL